MRLVLASLLAAVSSAQPRLAPAPSAPLRAPAPPALAAPTAPPALASLPVLAPPRALSLGTPGLAALGDAPGRRSSLGALRAALPADRRRPAAASRLWDASAVRSASMLAAPARDPQEGLGDPDGEALGRAFAEAALPLLEASPVAAPYARFYRERPIPILVSRPDPRLDRLQPRMGALFDQLYHRVELNRSVMGGFGGPTQPGDGALARAARAHAPTLLHELKHYLTRLKPGDAPLLENELEAHHVEALYELELLLSDPASLDELPEAVRERRLDLLEAWVRGPPDFARFVHGRYLKVPSLADPPELVRQGLEHDLGRWRERRERYDEQKGELEALARRAEALDGSWGGGSISAGPSRAALLRRELAEFPLREAVESTILKLEDSLVFWTDEPRRARVRAHYEAFWRGAQDDMRAFAAERPGFRVRPPGLLERLASGTRAAWRRWRGGRAEGKSRPR